MTAVCLFVSRRTIAQTRAAETTKKNRLVERSAISVGTPRFMTIAPIAWKSGNSNGICHGGPRTGSGVCIRSTPSRWKRTAV